MKFLIFVTFLFLVGCQSTPSAPTSDKDKNLILKFENSCPKIDQEQRINDDPFSEPLFTESPKYPIAAAKDGIEGYVKLSYDMSHEGQPTNIQIIESYPSDTFIFVAKEALKQWRFSPVLIEDKAVISKCHTIQFDFELN